MKYELVSGFETHIELSTKSKLFCSCSTEFGAQPNTLCCPVCLGHPGTLPVLNKQAVRLAVMAGLALNCKVNLHSVMERKNYSYPDLPKAYQITQLSAPLCEDGYLELSSGKRIRITRIQVEEDAGKLVHTDDAYYVDYNRCGVPLIEIVSEPDISSVEEAKEYVEKMRVLMRYIGVSDCKMQEGSMRCDVNISLKKQGATTLGTRTEIKNMNSVSAIARAMEYEQGRQAEILDAGGKVQRETLRFDDAKGVTISMRSKEDAQDYRFFREPDLLTVVLSSREIEDIKRSMPMLPREKEMKYTQEWGLTDSLASQLTKYRKISEFFDKTVEFSADPQLAAGFITGQIFSLFATEGEKEEFDIKTTPRDLARLCNLVEKRKISKNLAKVTLSQMLATGKGAEDLISPGDMHGVSEEELLSICQKALEESPRAVADYKGGKEKAIMAILGTVMRKSRGAADPESAKACLVRLLSDKT